MLGALGSCNRSLVPMPVTVAENTYYANQGAKFAVGRSVFNLAFPSFTSKHF
jgi:hypothetical protein